MKSSLTLLVLALLLLNILAGCAPGPNQSKGTASEHNVVAGFWLGLWQGFIAPFVFVVSFAKSLFPYICRISSCLARALRFGIAG
jgi:hypothetical protein